jgi:phosphatidyl-myo-inositol dimannoside synthase
MNPSGGCTDVSVERIRTIVAATGFFAPGGIERVCRQVVGVLSETGDVEAWSLCDGTLPAGEPLGKAARFRFARGRDWQLGRWAVGAAMGGSSNSILLLMHLHLAPLAIPWLARGRRVVMFLYGIEAWRPLSPLQRFVLARSELVAISPYTAKRFLQANPSLSSPRLDVCTLGIASDTPSGDDGRGLRRFALMVSRLSSEDRYKGHDRVIRAWPAIRARVPDARLAIVGDGDDRPRLEGLVRALGLEDAVHFAGRVTDAELGVWYARCDFFLLPSDQEGFGLVFLEAMRASKPCVSGPGAPESIVDEGTTGFIVSADDTDRLVDISVRLFSDRALRERLGASGRMKFLREFTDDRFADRLRALVVGAGNTNRAA